MTDKDKQAEQPFTTDPTGSLQARQDLRVLAETIARQQTALASAEIAAMTPEIIQQMLHELLVHRIELEMQNEELRRTQTKLQTSQERYFDLYDLAPVGYLTISDNGLIQEANLTAATLLDVPRRALISQPLSQFIFKDDQDVYYQHRKKFNICIPHMCELRMVKKDGTIFWVHLAITGMHQADDIPLCLLVLCDITERKQIEEALRQSEHLRNQSQETANDQLREQAESLASIYTVLDSVGLIVCDLEKSDARISIFSVGAEKLFGYQQTEAIGESIALIYPPELVGLIPARVERFRQGKPMHSFNMTLTRKSGEHFPAVVSVHPFAPHDGKFRKVVGVFRDITELIRAQEQLQSANTLLERRVERRTLELQETQKQYLHAEKLSAIGKLSASIAHEFNNPLQGILSILKGLKKRAILEPEDKELLDAAINESERIKNLIRSLQEFNRPSSGKKVPMDVHKSLNAVLLLHKSDFKNRHIAVELKYAEPLPQICAIPDQIKQVYLNLLTNAADACQESGSGVITVSTWQENGKVAVAIQDTGIGIKPEEMDHIFQPFYTTKPEVKGTGLGLSVSYGIIKQHHGEIQVESRPGEGTTFTILLPIKG